MPAARQTERYSMAADSPFWQVSQAKIMITLAAAKTVEADMIRLGDNVFLYPQAYTTTDLGTEKNSRFIIVAIPRELLCSPSFGIKVV